MNHFCRTAGWQALATALLGLSTPSFAGPEGGQVRAGAATIQQSGSATTVNQSSDRAVINWSRFSIAAGESVRFNQPGKTSATLNRVTGTERSDILGSLSANGQVFLLNPNGMLVGAGAQVSVGGFLASTLEMDDSDFMSGQLLLNGDSLQAVTYEGDLDVEDGAVVVLVAAEVNINGNINAPQGIVQLEPTNSLNLTWPSASVATPIGTTNPVLPGLGTTGSVVPSPSTGNGSLSSGGGTATPPPGSGSTVSGGSIVVTSTSGSTTPPSLTVTSAPTTVASSAPPAPPPPAPAATRTAPIATSAVTVRPQDGSTVAYTVDQGAFKALVNARGLVQVQGGKFVLTAKGRDELSKATVNQNGVGEAQSLALRQGALVLLADLGAGGVGPVGVDGLGTQLPAAVQQVLPASSN